MILIYPVFPDTILLTNTMLLMIEAFNRVGSVELYFMLLLVNVELDIVIFEFWRTKKLELIAFLPLM